LQRAPKRQPGHAAGAILRPVQTMWIRTICPFRAGGRVSFCARIGYLDLSTQDGQYVKQGDSYSRS
jgi:hypothetical protein